ncbi:serine/threonine-protein kinase [Nocardioides houyundeii]|uniref:serine/threonine-protein kinase n=1 Tax=Nocardioides houyundeii TaxID=2045452 RepID=UPI0013B45AA5|nr:serine/threonine-protein kinase [Nocardioides houyundeii]
MPPPVTLGRYPVRRRLGAGAFATVWLAHDEQLDSPVAIKVLADNWAGDEHVRQRFVEEGRFLRKVESPYVVPVYDAGELEDGRPFLVMAYADQGTLGEWLSRGPMTRAQALQVITEVGAGLTALHTRGVLHRDVKPGNVLLRSDDGRVRAMLADLGLGKELDMSSRLTVIAGTPSYVAPEQARGEALDGRADLFSLAALAYLLLAGRPVWSHQSLTVAAAPPPVPPMGEAVPAEVEAVVRRGLATDREQRPDSVREFTSALLAAAGGRSEAAPTQSGALAGSEPKRTVLDPAEHRPGSLSRARWSRRRVSWWHGMVAVAALALGVGGGWAVGELTRSETRRVDEGTVSVEVPRAWTASVQDAGWTPPGSERDFPALALGTGADWREAGYGVFVGLLPGSDLPAAVPGHAECSEQGRPVPERRGDDELLTVVHRGCPGAASVVVERVVQVAADRLLWVQVRSADRATAEQVLASVELDGG